MTAARLAKIASRALPIGKRVKSKEQPDNRGSICGVLIDPRKGEILYSVHWDGKPLSGSDHVWRRKELLKINDLAELRSIIQRAGARAARRVLKDLPRNPFL